MAAEHHYQKVDLETGYIEATRDDTDEYQDLRVKAYTPDGTLIQESRIIYNIQYDYCRRQEWKNGVEALLRYIKCGICVFFGQAAT